MRQRTFGVVMASVAVLGLGLAGAQSASAAPPSTGGCGGGHALVTIPVAVDLVDWRFLGGGDVPPPGAGEDIAAAVDRNEDGLVCIKQFKPNRGQDKHYGGVEGYVISLINDNRAVGRL